jgi:Restriction endonuclease
MPKRTNDFQTLIKHIYEQIVPDGGTVTESGMVFDCEASILREVDILVEYKYAGHEFNFVVECRDRSRTETVEWIDSLIGKVKSLKVNKVIAVSNKGFAESAMAKAKANGIETLTLEEANDTHWGEFPIKPGLLLITNDVYRINDCFYKKGDDWIPITELDIESDVYVNGQVVGNLKDIIGRFFQEYIVPEIDKHKKEIFLELFKTKEDAEKMMIVESENTWPEINAHDRDGNKVNFSTVRYIVLGERKTVDIDQRHMVFNNNLVSVGKHLETDGIAINFRIVQDPETRKLHVNWFQTKE